jgi:hypothetical protein
MPAAVGLARCLVRELVAVPSVADLRRFRAPQNPPIS